MDGEFAVQIQGKSESHHNSSSSGDGPMEIKGEVSGG